MNQETCLRSIVFTIIVSLIFAWPIMSDVPAAINYQGQLTNGTGDPVPNGTYTVVFTIYDAASGGETKWTETQSVSTTDGLFAVLLGSINPIADTVFVQSPRYLGAKIESDAEMSPRTMLVTIPWSFRVGSVDGATGGNITSKVSIGTGHTNSGENSFAAGIGNNVSGYVATISGGENNQAVDSAATVAGGSDNLAGSRYSSVGGGRNNYARGWYSVVAGGGGSTVADSNSANGLESVVSGGRKNSASGEGAVIAGGFLNKSTGYRTTVSGGQFNTANRFLSTVSGGEVNTANFDGATVGGGAVNYAGGEMSVVAGGRTDTASGHYSAIVGGSENKASGEASFIGGGIGNRATGDYSVVVGGGGWSAADSNSASGSYSTVGGGKGNHATYDYATIGGGMSNTASDEYCTVGGGANNHATSMAATVAGGDVNLASGKWAAVPGGLLNTAAGDFSFAAGLKAKANHKGTFVWADSTNADFASTGGNQFLIRASGGVGIGTNSPWAGLHIKGAGFPKSFGFFDTDAISQDAGLRFYEDGTPKSHIFHASGTNTLNLYGDDYSGIAITSTGRVGIGTTSPSEKLQVNGNICYTGSIGACSDLRYKKDITVLHGSLEKVTKMRGINYRWRQDEFQDRGFDDSLHLGFIAQEVEQLYPEMVLTDKNGYKSVDYSRLTPVLVEAIKEQQMQIDELRVLVNQLASQTNKSEAAYGLK